MTKEVTEEGNSEVLQIKGEFSIDFECGDNCFYIGKFKKKLRKREFDSFVGQEESVKAGETLRHQSALAEAANSQRVAPPEITFEEIIEVPELSASVEHIIQESVRENEAQRSESLNDIQIGKDDDDKDIFAYAKVPLATTEEIERLERKHVEFYGILSRIQDTHAAGDFKSAYAIQDRIAYLLNNRTLLYQPLTIRLITYIDTIIEKLDLYYDEIIKKQKAFKLHNKRVSAIREYQRRSDASMEYIRKTKQIADEELAKNDTIT